MALSGTASGLNFDRLSICDIRACVGAEDVFNGRRSINVAPDQGAQVAMSGQGMNCVTVADTGGALSRAQQTISGSPTAGDTGDAITA